MKFPTFRLEFSHEAIYERGTYISFVWILEEFIFYTNISKNTLLHQGVRFVNKSIAELNELPN